MVNLFPSCELCNKSKRANTISEWRSIYADNEFGIPRFNERQRQYLFLTFGISLYDDAATFHFEYEHRDFGKCAEMVRHCALIEMVQRVDHQIYIFCGRGLEEIDPATIPANSPFERFR